MKLAVALTIFATVLYFGISTATSPVKTANTEQARRMAEPQDGWEVTKERLRALWQAKEK